MLLFLLAWGGPTLHQDLWPTTLSALGLPAPSSWTGQPLGARADDEHRFATRHDGAEGEVMQLVERAGTKLLYDWSGARALHRLGEDPEELASSYSADDPEVEAVQTIHPGWTPVDPGP